MLGALNSKHHRSGICLCGLPMFILLANVGVTWFSLKMQQAERQKETVKAIEKLGVEVWYDYQASWEGNLRLSAPKPTEPKRLRRILGDDFFDTVLFVNGNDKPVTDAALQTVANGLPCVCVLCIGRTEVTDAGLKGLNRLAHLRTLCLVGNRITDAGFEHLKGMTQLHKLELDGTEITDAGLVHLKDLPHLEVLSLNDTSITDAGLQHVKSMSQLKELCLARTKVSDAGLENLKGLKQLRLLCVVDTQVTDEGRTRLRQSLPMCKIF